MSMVQRFNQAIHSLIIFAMTLVNVTAFPHDVVLPDRQAAPYNYSPPSFQQGLCANSCLPLPPPPPPQTNSTQCPPVFPPPPPPSLSTQMPPPPPPPPPSPTTNTTQCPPVLPPPPPPLLIKADAATTTTNEFSTTFI
ncbi:hypothetical protein O6P43_020603 [Quillaja saponaria]|uniref:Uncharacterized protein n=1 Tax=Quillaja saponaria TaxID=32244 RepID=A0AAD7LLD9_QUISA|nr:hypothetical protein O6P43_020603 [Quillaja saponaria]